MKVEKFDSSKKVNRVPLVRGDSTNGDKFIMSVLVDGSGIVIEFENEEAYLLPMQELVVALLRGREDVKGVTQI